MRLRRQPPVLEPRTRRVPHPWNRPETEFPGIVPVDSLLFERSEQAAIAITGIWAYTSGFEFAVTRLIQPEAPGWDEALCLQPRGTGAPSTGPPRSACSSPTAGRSSARDHTTTRADRPDPAPRRRWRHVALPPLAWRHGRFRPAGRWNSSAGGRHSGSETRAGIDAQLILDASRRSVRRSPQDHG